MARKTRQAEQPPADPFERLIYEFSRLPGVGQRSAERMAYHLLLTPYPEAMGLALAIRDVKKRLRPCAECGNLTEQELCRICADPGRDATAICVVEWPKDLRAIEKSGAFRGRYHVLMGRLSPLAGVEPDDLLVAGLLKRLAGGAVRELLLAMAPTVEGDATASFILDKARAVQSGLRVTRLAKGLPAGSELSFAQAGTLAEALRGRRELN